MSWQDLYERARAHGEPAVGYHNDNIRIDTPDGTVIVRIPIHGADMMDLRPWRENQVLAPHVRDTPAATAHLGRPGLGRDMRRRFHREARIIARLRHAGVPAVNDFGQDDDLFLVMEPLPGDWVGMLLDERGALPTAWAAFIGAQAWAVLAAAHSAGLIHRDVKPESLMPGQEGVIKVIDFGVATSTGDARSPGSRSPGSRTRTPARRGRELRRRLRDRLPALRAARRGAAVPVAMER